VVFGGNGRGLLYDTILTFIWKVKPRTLSLDDSGEIRTRDSGTSTLIFTPTN